MASEEKWAARDLAHEDQTAYRLAQYRLAFDTLASVFIKHDNVDDCEGCGCMMLNLEVMADLAKRALAGIDPSGVAEAVDIVKRVARSNIVCQCWPGVNLTCLKCSSHRALRALGVEEEG